MILNIRRGSSPKAEVTHSNTRLASSIRKGYAKLSLIGDANRYSNSLYTTLGSPISCENKVNSEVSCLAYLTTPFQLHKILIVDWEQFWILNWKERQNNWSWPSLIYIYIYHCKHGLRKTMKNMSQDGRSPARKLNTESTECGAELPLVSGC
jgi:hypothetical protein